MMERNTKSKTRRALVIACKRPVAGRVKTRLARSVGAERAASLYNAFLADTVSSAQAVPEATLALSFARSDDSSKDLAFFEQAFAGTQTWPQVEGDLGARIAGIFEQAAAKGFSEVLLVGSDAPHLSTADYAQALEGVARDGRVIGPTDDGGFWGVGLSSPDPRLFSNVEWSTERTLGHVLANAETAGTRFSLLPSTFDVDDEGGLERLQHWIAENGAGSCPRTEALLR